MRPKGTMRGTASAISLFLAASSAPAIASNSPVTPGIDALEIAVTLDPDDQTTAGTVRFSLDPEATGTSSPLRVLLHAEIDVESVSIDGGDAEWEAHDGFNPKHFWKRPDYKSLGEYDHVREIEVAPPTGGWSGDERVTFTYAGAIAESLYMPEEDYGRSFEQTSGLIEARGAFLAPGSAWVPFVPDDLVTFRLRANVPEAWDVVSQGKLVSRDVDAGVREVVFDCPYPMDGVYLVAGPWTLRRDTHGETDVMTYTYAEDDALTGRYIEATKRYLTRYEDEIGPYPFSKFALVENFWETGYGMPSFTLLGSTVIRLPFIIDTSYGHEILHCWWGNGVFVDTVEGNWCEGLTSYMADYAYKRQESDAAARDYRRNQLTGYLNYVTGGRDMPLSAFTQRHSGATQAIGYGKSLMLFHMMERHIGTEAFGAAVRAFNETYTYRAAAWSDLIDAFEEASGEELGWFADQWILQSGAPTLRVSSLEIRPSDGNVIAGVIEQEEPAYRIDVPVELTTTSGDTVRTIVECEGTHTPFRLACDSEPLELRVDPDFDIFRKLHRGEIPPVLSQTMGADSVIIIVPSGGSESLREAYVSLAERWARRDGISVVAEEDLLNDPGGVRERVQNAAVWLFGEISLASHALARGAEASELPGVVEELIGSPKLPPTNHSLVATVTHPWNSALSWSWLWLSNVESAEAIGRKVPHYGKYSYLIFDGAANIGKGTWQRSASPLTIDLRALKPPAVGARSHG